MDVHFETKSLNSFWTEAGFGTSYKVWNLLGSNQVRSSNKPWFVITFTYINEWISTLDQHEPIDYQHVRVV